ncbi:MAG: RnfABCDGE type electron transport complex subunit D [Treponema sp.]|jgi:electron transport complex protein RnfD|nr:RnfABCDGE type electron transport complex subunit D [Treponema sp.]
MIDRKTVKLNTQVNLARSTAVRMWLVFGCAFLAVTQSAIGDSGASFAVAITALVSAVMAELLMTSTVHGLGKIKDGSAAASAMVLALLLPNHIPPVYAALGAVFAMVVVKHSFGGLGSNWMNPALGGWLFIRFSWPRVFAAALNGSAEYLPQTGSAADQAIRDFFNRIIFLFVGAELPAGYIDLFSLQSPGIIADRAVLVLIFAVAIIAACEISRSWLSVLYLAVFGFLFRMAGDSGAWWNGDVIFAVLSGGTLVTAFILVVDPSSGAKSVPGNIIVVILAAVLSMAFRVFASAFYGCFFAVALVNALTPFLCRLERRLLYSLNPAGGVK